MLGSTEYIGGAWRSHRLKWVQKSSFGTLNGLQRLIRTHWYTDLYRLQKGLIEAHWGSKCFTFLDLNKFFGAHRDVLAIGTSGIQRGSEKVS